MHDSFRYTLAVKRAEEFQQVGILEQERTCGTVRPMIRCAGIAWLELELVTVVADALVLIWVRIWRTVVQSVLDIACVLRSSLLLHIDTGAHVKVERSGLAGRRCIASKPRGILARVPSFGSSDE